MILEFVKRRWPLIIAGFFVWWAFISSLIVDIEKVYGFKLPGMVKNQGVRDYIDRVTESDIESARDGSKGRRASINKKPWLEGNDNLHAMESLVWPDFGNPGGPEIPDWRFPDDDIPDLPSDSYCVFYSPNIITENCDEPYTVEWGFW